MDPNTSIQFLPGVGPARAKLFHKLGADTLRDLCCHFPRSYLNLTRIIPIAEANAEEACAVRVRILRKRPEARIRKGLSLFKLTAADDSGEVNVTFFNAKYAFEALRLDEEYLFYGPVKPGHPPEMASPQVFPVNEAGSLRPIYPLTAGLSSKTISQCVRRALGLIADSLPDPVPDEVREERRLCGLRYALEHIHFPADVHEAQIARERLIFEELFTLAVTLSRMHARTRTLTALCAAPFDPEPFYRSLPFSPTAAQRRAVGEILADLTKDTPMSRLLQGDVGSGKTLVAAAACLAAIRSGMQCAVMAPTEILAEQHRETFERFLAPFGVRPVLITGSTPVKERRVLLAGIEAGEVDLIVGTHALFSAGVTFHRLGLCVTDEQHRFGVAQRVALQEKSENPHVLVMSATPIPRTLALMIYGDLDLSVLDELPGGRIPVSTYCIPTAKLPRAWAFVRGLLDEGRQGYVVCPLVHEDEDSPPDLKSAEQLAEELAAGPLAGCRIGVLHGKLAAAKKEDVMRRFKDGEIQLLVSTTVIEVGVDVPNAAVMVCMNAERFGLSQLHQLRGRVGRGNTASHCILVSDARGETARERLRALCETTDGFRIAQTDLRLRGPGDFFGDRQHGLPEMRIADMASDVDVLAAAQAAAAAVLEGDPALSQPGHRALLESCERMARSVGQRPN